LRTFTSSATMYKYTVRLIVHWVITGTAKGGQRHERDPQIAPLRPAYGLHQWLTPPATWSAGSRRWSVLKHHGQEGRRHYGAPGTCRYRTAGSGDRPGPRNCW
jgi:hypothetical protein